MLNYCVRYENRWNHLGIITGFNWQLPTFPGRFHPSIIGVYRLNYCVRYGNRWYPIAIITRSFQRYSLKTKQKFYYCILCILVIFYLSRHACMSGFFLSQALDLLVPVSYIHCCTSTPGLSTLSSTRGLTRLLYEKPHLKAGFTLRCFQRLSFPNVATQLYSWRNNWYTIGSSTPVLSY